MASVVCGASAVFGSTVWGPRQPAAKVKFGGERLRTPTQPRRRFSFSTKALAEVRRRCETYCVYVRSVAKLLTLFAEASSCEYAVSVLRLLTFSVVIAVCLLFT